MRRMGYAVAGFVAAAVLFAGAAQAQVAAPSLNPVLVEGTIVTPNRLIEPYNPAGLPWSGASRIGLVLADLKAEDTTAAGVATPGPTMRGKVLQLRLVGDMFAAALEKYDGPLEDVSGGSAQIAGTLASVAMRLGDSLSIGVAQQQTKFNDPTSEEVTKLPVLGVTWRLGSAVYLGAAAGTETVTQSFSGTSVEGDRGVLRYGIAYHWREGSGGMHLELYRETVDVLDTPTFTRDGQDTDAVTLEVVFSDILLGIAKRSGEATGPGGAVTREIDLQTITVGWAPMMGLSVVLSVMQEESLNQPSATRTDVETKFLGVAWAF